MWFVTELGRHIFIDIHLIFPSKKWNQYRPGVHPTYRSTSTNWFHFRVNGYGEVDKVWHPHNETLEVVNIKKAIISQLSARLHMSNMNTRSTWAYYINETDTTDTGDKLVFDKYKPNGHTTVPNSEGFHEKRVEYRKAKRVPEFVESVVNFTAPNKPVPGNQADTKLPGDPNKDHGPGWANDLVLPTMTVISRDYIKLTAILTTDDHTRIVEPGDLKEDYLEVKNHTTVHKKPLNQIYNDLMGNISMVAKIPRADSAERLNYLQTAAKLMRLLSDSDITVLAKKQLDNNPKSKFDHALQHVTMDVIGMMRTNHSMELIVEYVLKNVKSSAKLVAEGMVNFVKLEFPPPEVSKTMKMHT
ncbi:unnamed protein product [Owenia fusiformis]|uniref:Uncharacterized protein n=1 Tax=Owenia fusiformis TaxID=6347 RepID=A0A8S4NP43_OWEFU|nr:unnamed protein product [Owenia fusiformis]